MAYEACTECGKVKALKKMLSCKDIARLEQDAGESPCIELMIYIYIKNDSLWLVVGIDQESITIESIDEKV